MQNSLGLLETHYGSNAISLYDNALAAIAFTIKGKTNEAKTILNYFNQRLLSELMQGSGGFFQFRNSIGQPYGNRWLGDNAWLLIALNNYQSISGDNSFQSLQYSLDQWIRQQQDVDGGLWGGEDAQGNRIGKVTEGMLDAFNAVKGYGTFHKDLLHFLALNRWDSAQQVLTSWPGSDYELALDNFTWGYCAFEDMPYNILLSAGRFETTQWSTMAEDSVTGYCFDEDRDAVWLEGSAQMSVALSKANELQSAQMILREIAKSQTTIPGIKGSLGIPYSANPGTGYGGEPLWLGADSNPSTAAMAWFIMAANRYDPMQIQYSKGIPLSDRFWQ